VTTKYRTHKLGAFGAFALGIAFLLITGATYALWTDNTSTPLDDQTIITAGSWEIEIDTAEADWYNVEVDTVGGNDEEELIDISTFRVVPGSIIEARVEVTIDLDPTKFDGDELIAEITSIGADDAFPPSAGDLSDFIEASADIYIDPVDPDKNIIAIRFTFPLDEEDYGTQAEASSKVDLGSVKVTVTQVRTQS